VSYVLLATTCWAICVNSPFLAHPTNTMSRISILPSFADNMMAKGKSHVAPAASSGSAKRPNNCSAKPSSAPKAEK